MMPIDRDFVLIILGYVMTGMLTVVWWFYRGSVSRTDECLRHLEEDLSALSRELGELRVSATQAGGELSGRCAVLEGRIDAMMTFVQEHGVELKGILPRVAVLEEAVGAGSWRRDD
jgi:hypothetical protein